MKYFPVVKGYYLSPASLLPKIREMAWHSNSSSLVPLQARRGKSPNGRKPNRFYRAGGNRGPSRLQIARRLPFGKARNFSARREKGCQGAGVGDGLAPRLHLPFRNVCDAPIIPFRGNTRWEKLLFQFIPSPAVPFQVRQNVTRHGQAGADVTRRQGITEMV